MSELYLLRIAVPEDAETVARHRALMFTDMGLLPQEENTALMTATIPWISNLLLSSEYKGWFLELNGQIVAGGGLHLSEVGPVPGCPSLRRRGHIANIYTAPTHRRRGLARRLMEEMVKWSEQNNIDQLTLEASSDGRTLYESFGFTATSMMRRTAPR